MRSVSVVGVDERRPSSNPAGHAIGDAHPADEPPDDVNPIASWPIATASPFVEPRVAVATVPLMLSMGVAEWQLTRYVERRNRAMDAAHDIETFAHAAWRGLLISLGTHAAALLALSLVTVLGIFLTIGSIPGEALTLLAAYLLLGAALFLALVLTSWGRISMVLPFMALAVAAIWLTALSTHSTAEELTEYLLASAALAGCFFTLGWREVRVVTNHST